MSVGTYEQVNAEAKERSYLACISSAEERIEIVAKVSSTGKTNYIILYWTYKKCREPSGMVVGRWKPSKLH